MRLFLCTALIATAFVGAFANIKVEKDAPAPNSVDKDSPFLSLSLTEKELKQSLFGAQIDVNLNKNGTLIPVPSFISLNSGWNSGIGAGGSLVVPLPLGLIFPSMPALNFSLGFTSNKNVSFGLNAGSVEPTPDPNGWGWESSTTPSPGWAPPSSTPGWAPPSSTPGWAPPSSTPGWAPPSSTPGWAPPSSTPGWAPAPSPTPAPTPGWGDVTTPGWASQGWPAPAEPISVNPVTPGWAPAPPSSTPGWAPPPPPSTTTPGWSAPPPSSTPGWAPPPPPPTTTPGWSAPPPSSTPGWAPPPSPSPSPTPGWGWKKGDDKESKKE